MNLNPVIRRRVALVSAMSAALIATGYAAAEHTRADSLNYCVRQLERETTQTVCPYSGSVSTTAQTAADEESPLPKIRQAARDFIGEKKPGAKVDGVFTLVLDRNNSLAIAGADTTIDGQRRTVDLLVRLYTRKGGGTYWRAESLSGERAASLMETQTIKMRSED